jgi:hypothetical protein
VSPPYRWKSGEAPPKSHLQIRGRIIMEGGARGGRRRQKRSLKLILDSSLLIYQQIEHEVNLRLASMTTMNLVSAA